ncbi:MAG: NADH:ubiquinone reductase (Na(+)-transporting) subunit C [Bacteroidales bacterium]|nr:NADH:ubiquinone reductase (Na(+)-transporting) subunit C [Bacteroidales bacterium]
MDTNKNLYTILYATGMVVVVAVVLAFASSLLKERQQRNVEIERKQMILRSVHLAADANTVEDKDSYIEQEYAKYITDSSITEGEKQLTLYICKIESGERFYILPLHGVGLWGPVWGYISLKGDFNSVYGATFDHKSETPGLGAEISTNEFSNQFENKRIFDEKGDYVSVQVVKGGAKEGNYHQVDAISGGTITSKAVEDMLLKNIREYMNFFSQNLKAAQERALEKARADEQAAFEAELKAKALADSVANAEKQQRYRAYLKRQQEAVQN